MILHPQQFHHILVLYFLLQILEKGLLAEYFLFHLLLVHKLHLHHHLILLDFQDLLNLHLHHHLLILLMKK
jgi:hypothetical protein